MSKLILYAGGPWSCREPRELVDLHIQSPRTWALNVLPVWVSVPPADGSYPRNTASRVQVAIAAQAHTREVKSTPKRFRTYCSPIPSVLPTDNMDTHVFVVI